MQQGEIQQKNNITFMLDGETISVSDIAPDTTILNYLREDLNRTGTKEGCAEGDCGACTVVVADLHQDELRYRAINACIQFLPTLDGKALYTVESLQNAEKSSQLHPVQQAMYDCHASQCGFCTPGFVMSLFALYKNQPNANRSEVSDALSGNLCRCTGYRPILDAGQQMYAYAEQLPDDELNALSAPANRDTAFREQLIQSLKSLQTPEHTLNIQHDGKRFLAPRTTAELCTYLSQYPQATLLAGSTDVGLWVTKHYQDLPVILYLGQLAELDRVTENHEVLEIGAAVTLEDAWQTIIQHYPELRELYLRFASLPIRNSGTLVGNIANGSPIGDSMPALITLDSSLLLRSENGLRELPLDQFYLDYRKQDLQPGEFVEAVRIPLPGGCYKNRASTPLSPRAVPPNRNRALSAGTERSRSQTEEQNTILQCYKISKRFEQDISAVCAAFRIDLDNDKRIQDIRIAFGGMAAIPKRARLCETMLLGQSWEKSNIEQAMHALEQDFAPLTDMRASADYRMTVAKNLLLKCYLDAPSLGETL